MSKSKSKSAGRPEPIWLYSVKEVADQCGLSVKTIYRHIESRKLRVMRAGRSIRISHEELTRFLGLAPYAV